MNKSTRFVLVTGASSGIGKACCSLLAKNGFHVFAATREIQSLKDLHDSYPKKIHPIKMDITDETSIQKSYSRIKSMTSEHGLSAIINSAGICIVGPLECLTIDHLREQFEVNTFGTFSVIKAFIPLVIAGKGRIINISSISGRTTFPFSGCYSASKAALNVLSQALNLELQPWHIPVIVVELGIINTPIWNKIFKRLKDLVIKMDASYRVRYDNLIRRTLANRKSPSDRIASPESVAIKICKILSYKNPRSIYTLGRDANIIKWITLILPPFLFDKIKIMQYGLNESTLEK